MTVRMALGAGRGRLVRQLLVETLMLAAAGGALGLFVSNAGSHLLVNLAIVPISLDTGADANVLLFAAGLTLLCAILFGLVPAFKATRVEVATALRAQGRTLIGSRTRAGRFGAGRALVVVQITLSTVLLIGAGLLIRSMQRIVTADLGFDRNRLVMVHVSTQRAGYSPERAGALARTLPERVRALPGVVAASTTLHGLFTGGYGTLDLLPEGAARAASPFEVKYDAVGSGYFGAIGARLRRGREFDARDSASGAKAVILNDSLARRLFGDTDPVGATLRDDQGATYSIVGVVGDIHEASVRDGRVQEAYIPIFQKRQNGFWLAAHVDRDPAASIETLRRAVLDVDPSLPLQVNAFNDLAGESVAEDRLTMQATTFFGFVALLLAALGLHGVTSYGTSQRSGEFGLRMALGAEPDNVVRLVLGESAVLGVAGLAFGIPIGVAATRLIRDQIFGVGRIDPPSLAAAVALLILTTLLAAYLPARRAARIPPLEALRTE
jgi:predicted permease